MLKRWCVLVLNVTDFAHLLFAYGTNFGRTFMTKIGRFGFVRLSFSTYILFSLLSLLPSFLYPVVKFIARLVSAFKFAPFFLFCFFRHKSFIYYFRIK